MSLWKIKTGELMIKCKCGDKIEADMTKYLERRTEFFHEKPLCTKCRKLYNAYMAQHKLKQLTYEKLDLTPRIKGNKTLYKDGMHVIASVSDVSE